MFSHETSYRVRYADTDQMGYVYYGNYARLYEIGRVEALRSLGVAYKSLEASGIVMPVYELTCRYLQPARYDDLLTIRTRITAMPAARIVFDFEVRNQEGQPLNTGQATLVFLRKENNRLTAAPPALLEALRTYFKVPVG